jgi:hypothetical protein
VIFPDDPSRWSTGSPFVRLSRTAPAAGRPTVPGPPPPVGADAAANTGSTPGGFTATNLPVGRYAVLALPPGTPWFQPERQTLERWRESATTVTVEVGQASTVKLTPIK